MFWFRRRVPDALRAAVGKREFVQSLRTRDPRQARAGAAKLTAETDILLTDLERKATAAAPDPTPVPPPTRDAIPHGPGGWIPPPPEPLPGDAEMRSAVAELRGRLLAEDARSRLAAGEVTPERLAREEADAGGRSGCGAAP